MNPSARGTVLAIHGVGNRNAKRFTEREVRPLAEALGRTVGDDVLAVFWGDLAPQNEILQSVPEPSEGQALGESLELVVGGPDETPPEVVDALAEQVRSKVGRRTHGVLSPAAESAVREAIAEARVTNDVVARVPELADALAELVLAAEPAGAAELHVGFPTEQVKRAVRTMVSAVDRAVGREVGEVLQRALRGQEAALGATIARTAGDVLTYGQGGVVGARIRGRLDAAYQDSTRDGGPVHLLAHSLGSLVAAEWLLGADCALDDGREPTPIEKRAVHTFVTFGAQVAIFSELHGLRGPASEVFSAGSLPVRVERWVNVWHQLDPLAFVSGRVLRYGPGAGVPVQDLRLELDSLPDRRSVVSFHSSYWKDPRFARWLAGFLVS